MHREVQLFGDDRETRGRANASPDPGIIESTRCGSPTAVAGRRKVSHYDRESAAGIDAIAEIAENPHDFVVAPTRIESRLDEKVRRTIQAITAGVHKVI